ncbi:hypothetical protein Q5P01_008791 [Channa striata]|uniref:Uncharacterized protein n=1 Tax=Channa striata TaxID=64152 RepID=A0AA88ST09_CHASR|nr:hypothetical protein Q5P01_008791 [Channa striata]
MDILDLTRIRRGSTVYIVVCFSSAEVRVHAPASTQAHGHILVCRYKDTAKGVAPDYSVLLRRRRPAGSETSFSSCPHGQSWDSLMG